jgi:Ca-activated chloride channel homolog
MNLKVVRASLPAVLTAALLMSLLPPIRTVFAAGQAQQDSAPSRVRRGKNGEPVSKALDNRDDARVQDSAPPNSSPAQTAPAAFSAPTSGQSKAAASSENGRQSAEPPPADTSQDSSQSQQEREAPPFDRPPLGSQRPSKRSSPDRAAGSSQSNSKRPTYSDADTGSPSDSRGTYGNRPQSSTPSESNRGSYPDSSTGGQADRSGRDGGQPPVLHRQSDSRPSGDDGTAPIDAGRQSGAQRGTGQRQPGGEDEVVKLESTLVSIPLLVSDRSGRYVPQLRASDFLLYEDGVQQTIASLGNEEVPFNVALMLDVSPSVAGSVKDIQDAAIAFVRQLRSQDRVMVVSFDRQIHYLSDFTSDRRELERAIRSAQLGSGTSVYDAVYETVERKLRNIEGRKALILLSDGEDTTSSRASYDDAVNLVSESDVLVYGLRYPGTGGGRGGTRVNPWPRSPIPNIPLPFPWPFPRRPRGPFNISGSAPVGNSAVQSWPHRRDGGRDFMKDLAAAGGGTVYDAQRISDMSSVANKIADELRHVYVVSYYPSNALSNGGYRKVRVSVKSRDEIAVRHRPGYNARPNGTARPTI